MNKRLVVIASSIAAIALVAALSYRAISRSDGPARGSAAQTGDAGVVLPEMRQLPGVSDPAARDAGDPARLVEEAAEAAAEAAREAEAAAQEAAQALGPRDQAAERPSPFEDLALFDEEVVAELIKQYGSLEAIYELANASERMDLVDMLAGEESLRGHIAALLQMETDPEIRTQMLDSVDPIGFFDQDMDDDFVDQDLLDILNRPTATPMTEEEFMARMDLAHLISQEDGLKWANRARLAFPNSEAVQLMADSLVLHTAASLGSGTVSRNQATTAMENLYSRLSHENAMVIYNADERIRGYYTLYPFDSSPVEAHRTLAFYRERIQVETDPRALDLLIGLDQRIVQRHGDIVAQTPPPAPEN